MELEASRCLHTSRNKHKKKCGQERGHLSWDSNHQADKHKQYVMETPCIHQEEPIINSIEEIELVLYEVCESKVVEKVEFILYEFCESIVKQ